MPPPPQHGGQGMSTFDKMKMGAVMGTCVGLTMGFIFGGYSIFKHGAGPNGVLRSLGQYMLGSAATFGFFMSIGTAIRTEGPEGTQKMLIWQALMQKAREERRQIPIVVAARPVLNSRWAEERKRED